MALPLLLPLPQPGQATRAEGFSADLTHSDQVPNLRLILGRTLDTIFRHYRAEQGDGQAEEEDNDGGGRGGKRMWR